MSRFNQAYWTVCQIGAREDFAVARALDRRSALELLITDLWVPRGRATGYASERLAGRRHDELRIDRVWAPTGTALMRELGDRIISRSGWDQIMARNAWFQSASVGRLKALPPRSRRVIFAYSYAAEKIFAFARKQGWMTILGQIDPGLAEARMVDQLHRKTGVGAKGAPPPQYWESWRRETELADVIVVNSAWSRDGLLAEGVPASKLSVLPLAFEATWTRSNKVMPIAFSHERPLRLLFLGQVNLRKGIDILLEAMECLRELPIKLDVVGPIQIPLSDKNLQNEKVRFHGSVARSSVRDFYQEADVFIFPTRSDGFGLTQLEAFSAGLPVIASKNCGEVVSEGRNGLLLPDLDPQTMTDVLRKLLSDPQRMAKWHRDARVDHRFSLEVLGARLLALDKTGANSGTDKNGAIIT